MFDNNYDLSGSSKECEQKACDEVCGYKKNRKQSVIFKCVELRAWCTLIDATRAASVSVLTLTFLTFLA